MTQDNSQAGQFVADTVEYKEPIEGAKQQFKGIVTLDGYTVATTEDAFNDRATALRIAQRMANALNK